MIRTNLSTRPFYNERVVRLAMVLVAVIVAAATAFNVTRIMRYSSSDTRLATQASRDEARAADLRQQAAQLRASVDPQQVELASAGARQANDLIDRRTFSWTELLNRFETTLPDDVHLTAIRPRVDRDRGIVLRVSVTARSVDDVEEFMTNLGTTGVFPDVLVVEEHFDDDGLLQSMLEMGYLPAAAKPTVTQAAGDKAAEERAVAEAKAAADQAEADAREPAPEEPSAPVGRGRGGATRR
jgi:Tfp pilus assembly protein PilN